MTLKEAQLKKLDIERSKAEKEMRQQMRQVREDFNEDDLALETGFVRETALEIASKILGRNRFGTVSARESLELRSSREGAVSHKKGQTHSGARAKTGRNR